MKKICAIVLAVFLVCAFAYADVTVKVNGTSAGRFETLDFDAGTTVTRSTSDGSAHITRNSSAATGNLLFQTTIVANGYKPGVTENVSTESNLTSAALAYGVIDLQYGAAKTIMLAAGTKGQCVTIQTCNNDYDGKAITVNLTLGDGVTVASTGWSVIAFAGNGQAVSLCWIDNTVGWVITGVRGSPTITL